MTVLSVNLNKIAWVRNSRGGHRPSVVEAASIAIQSGAKGITVHPRPDQRHINPRDVHDLAVLLANKHPEIEFNIEGNPMAAADAQGYPGFDAFVESHQPAQATLVPDSNDQLTSDHGFDLSRFDTELAERIAHYQSHGARVSLFMDPDLGQIEQAKAHGADRIELYTGPFAQLFWSYGADHQATQTSLRTYQHAAEFATKIGLGVNAGHDLDLQNLPAFLSFTTVQEVSIGHALISDALERGLATAVKEYVKVLTK
ncbi:MAG: pyridoxine 5'-phosphate synthase [Pseudomonadales bacterium]|jgi:pyridoxine 5-phosphate synthase|nr:pyridoxine 5'-phosphate synthase [Pseudomonadales bacterium]